jgi:hypothetical protein
MALKISSCRCKIIEGALALDELQMHQPAGRIVNVDEQGTLRPGSQTTSAPTRRSGSVRPHNRDDAAAGGQALFEPRRIRAEGTPEDEKKTPDFKLLKDGTLRAYCEVKSSTDGDLFELPDDLAPGEIRVEVHKDPAIFSLARHIAKAARQFEAANPDRSHPNILIIVNHARRKGPADLRMALEGIRAPDGRRFFPLVNDDDKWGVQEDVWEAARSIDLYVWVDPQKRTWQSFRPTGAQRLAEACNLLGISLA